MTGDILGGALIGGAVGGLVVGAFALYAKLTGKPLGRNQAPAQGRPPVGRPQTAPVPATWKTETTRVLMGLVWFLALWFLARVVLGAVVGGITGAQMGAQAAPGTDNRAEVFVASQVASVRFLHQYGLWVLLGSLLAAVAGTLTGFLPGTKRATRIVPPPGPPPEGQWPPPPSGAA